MDAPPAPDALRLVRVRSRAALDAFIELPYRLNAATAHWVPPLRRDQRTLLDRLRHPFHEHAQVEYFLALRGKCPVGRIAVLENFRHNQVHGEKIGFFGFLDAEDDAEVFALLLRGAEAWCRRRGLTALRGPCSFSTNEECGLLVENHHCDPMVMMPYHLPYYQSHVEGCGYGKAEDLLCFWIVWEKVPERIQRLADGAQRRLERLGHTVRIRPLDPKRWEAEVDLVKRLYNKAWERNWGFVPLTDAEMDFLAGELRPIVDPNLVLFVEVDGEPAAMTIALPDYNQVLKVMDGRLGPVQLALALWMRRRLHRMRLLMMGVLPEFRGRGLEVMMYRDLGHGAAARGIKACEFSWILERNTPMIHQALAFGCREYRRYRLYEKALSPT
jgi:GNAT superfamily N-acetyltransferase